MRYSVRLPAGMAQWQHLAKLSAAGRCNRWCILASFQQCLAISAIMTHLHKGALHGLLPTLCLPRLRHVAHTPRCAPGLARRA